MRAAPQRLRRRMAEWRQRARVVLQSFTTAERNFNGFVAWEGPSRFDGTPIVVVITGIRTPASNPKTGDMVQAYILPADEIPREAIRTGGDRSVCGDCKQRPSKGGKCYVTVQFGPGHIWRYYRAHRYPKLTPDGAAALLQGATMRFGAWGDPAAVPLEVWTPMLEALDGHTGYTHAWRDLGEEWHWLTASVDSPTEHFRAQRRGWRTFRVRPPGAPLLEGELECLADAHGVTCLACQGCNGSAGAGRPSFAIVEHGFRVAARVNAGKTNEERHQERLAKLAAK